jgi:cytochrome c biogenesis protein CcmG/thiol:disulfide interchange protein DsbE
MNRRVKLFIPVAFFLLLAGFLLFGLHRDPNIVPSALVDHPFPEFSQPGLYPGQGPFTLDDLKGKILLVNVWGSWCIPCHVEHPFLMALSEEEPDLTFVGITYDDSIEADRDFLEDKGSPFDIDIVDLDKSLRIDLGTTGAPETFLVDQNGMILYRQIGALDATIWKDKFVPLLDQIR